MFRMGNIQEGKDSALASRDASVYWQNGSSLFWKGKQGKRQLKQGRGAWTEKKQRHSP
jgi:hypothetical protein